MASPDARADAVLARAAASNDRDALEALLARHVDRIYAVCCRILGPDDAMDATQEAMLSVTRSIAKWDERAAFTTWLHRVAVNAALDEARRRARRPMPSDLLPDVVASASGIDGVADRLEVDAGLAAVPEEFRVAVVLRDLCDLDYAQIATVLDIPVGTVRSRIARGRAALAEIIGNPNDGSRRLIGSP